MRLTNVTQAPGTLTPVNTLADRLRQAREAIQLTQPELARRAGVSTGTIGNLESGARKSPRELLAIAAALGVHPEWLKTGRGPRAVSVAREPEPRYANPPSLSEALAVLSIQLAKHMADDVREDVADALAKLARRRGQERDQHQVLTLLGAPKKRTGTDG